RRAQTAPPPRTVLRPRPSWATLQPPKRTLHPWPPSPAARPRLPLVWEILGQARPLPLLAAPRVREHRPWMQAARPAPSPASQTRPSAPSPIRADFHARIRSHPPGPPTIPSAAGQSLRDTINRNAVRTAERTNARQSQRTANESRPLSDPVSIEHIRR